MIHTVNAGSYSPRPGDVALVQHMDAFQTASKIGKDCAGASDAHNMVVVVARRCVDEKHGCIGSTAKEGSSAAAAAASTAAATAAAT